MPTSSEPGKALFNTGYCSGVYLERLMNKSGCFLAHRTYLRYHMFYPGYKSRLNPTRHPMHSICLL